MQTQLVLARERTIRTYFSRYLRIERENLLLHPIPTPSSHPHPTQNPKQEFYFHPHLARMDLESSLMNPTPGSYYPHRHVSVIELVRTD